MTIRVLVADDQAIVRAGFAGLLSTQDDIEVVGQAVDGAEAVDLAARHRPDVALLDIRMPRMDGIEAARRILADAPRTRALMITTFDVDDYVYAALAAGASGFLLKDATAPELLEAVRVVARGDALLAPSVTKRLVAEFARQRRRLVVPRQVEELTAREREVLTLIAAGLSNGEIAGELVVSESTVKSHINRLFAKLGLRDRAQAVIFAYEHGLAGNG
ncbi:response regulator [Sinosporangium siamense]|nr:response regulator transcription factor [Sinosporangium siamense]